MSERGRTGLPASRPCRLCSWTQPRHDAPNPAASLADPGHPAAAPRPRPGKDPRAPHPVPLQTPPPTGGFSGPTSHTPVPHHHPGLGVTAQPWCPRGCPGSGEMVVGLFSCSSKMMLNPPGASELLLSIQVLGQDQAEGLKLEQIQRQGQPPHWDGEEGALPRAGHPNQPQRCCLLGRVLPGCGRVVGESGG